VWECVHGGKGQTTFLWVPYWSNYNVISLLAWSLLFCCYLLQQLWNISSRDAITCRCVVHYLSGWVLVQSSSSVHRWGPDINLNLSKSVATEHYITNKETKSHYEYTHVYRLWSEISVCEYLRDFSEKMEGTHEGMRLALPPPKCHSNGSFEPTQCVEKDGDQQCWCVDSFGSEIPGTR
jgi:hypothetical protein